MGSTNNDGFLHNLDKMFGASKDKGTVTLTLKRFTRPDNGKYKPGTKQKREIIEVEKQKSLQDPDMKFSLILHAKSNNNKVSTEVEPEKVGPFESSLVNVCRLYCFKNVLQQSKKIKKATPRNPLSKTSKKLEARKQVKKLKKMKKKEKSIQRHITSKINPNKMEIESAK